MPILWRLKAGSILVDHFTSRSNETSHWVTVRVANTLGTALGDFVATDAGSGFDGGAIVFAALIALVAIAHFFTHASKAVLFWAAYVLTRPLGTTLGDFLTKSTEEGGLELGRITSSLVLAAVMVGIVAMTMRRQREPAMAAGSDRSPSLSAPSQPVESIWATEQQGTR